MQDTIDTAQEEKRKNRRYPWDTMPVDGSITITMKSEKAIKSAINSAYGYGKRANKKFIISRLPNDDPEKFTVKIIRVL